MEVQNSDGLTCDNLQISKVTIDALAPANLHLIAIPCPPNTQLGEYLQAASAPNSRRAYRSDLLHFLNCGGSIPSSVEFLVQYLCQNAKALRPSTLVRRL